MNFSFYSDRISLSFELRLYIIRILMKYVTLTTVYIVNSSAFHYTDFAVMFLYDNIVCLFSFLWHNYAFSQNEWRKRKKETISTVLTKFIVKTYEVNLIDVTTIVIVSEMKEKKKKNYILYISPLLPEFLLYDCDVFTGIPIRLRTIEALKHTVSQNVFYYNPFWYTVRNSHATQYSCVVLIKKSALAQMKC